MRNRAENSLTRLVPAVLVAVQKVRLLLRTVLLPRAIIKFSVLGSKHAQSQLDHARCYPRIASRHGWPRCVDTFLEDDTRKLFILPQAISLWIDQLLEGQIGRASDVSEAKTRSVATGSLRQKNT